jgi:hypothetical protein
MEESKKSGHPSPFSFMVALSLATVAMPSVTMAQAQVAALAPSNEISGNGFGRRRAGGHAGSRQSRR